MLTGLRTVIANLFLTVLAIIALVAPEEAANLPSAEEVGQAAEWLTAGLLILWGPINILLRLVTRGPFPWDRLRRYLRGGTDP